MLLRTASAPAAASATTALSKTSPVMTRIRSASAPSLSGDRTAAVTSICRSRAWRMISKPVPPVPPMIKILMRRPPHAPGRRRLEQAVQDGGLALQLLALPLVQPCQHH